MCMQVIGCKICCGSESADPDCQLECHPDLKGKQLPGGSFCNTTEENRGGGGGGVCAFQTRRNMLEHMICASKC